MSHFFKVGSKTPEIIDRWKQNQSLREIATAVGCTKANVIGAIRRHMVWNNRVECLPPDYHDWLIREASKTHTSPAVYARALLIDAINDAMENG